MTEREQAIPYVAIGNDELGDPLGPTIKCPICGAQHPIKNSEPPKLQFYLCGEDAYLAGLDGREILR